MELKYKTICFKKDSDRTKVPNNYVENVRLSKINNDTYKVTIDFKHRYYEILAFCGGSNSNGVMVEYCKNPHEENEKIRSKDEYCLDIEFEGFPSEKFDVFTDRHKESLELLFIKRKAIENEKIITNKGLKPRK